MNGCELPGGAVLVVEPSDPTYKQRQENQSDCVHYGPDGVGLESSAPLQHTNIAGPNTDGTYQTPLRGSNNESVEAINDRGLVDDDDDDDNLDNFFASLE